jgi:hypothetical protein
VRYGNRKHNERKVDNRVVIKSVLAVNRMTSGQLHFLPYAGSGICRFGPSDWAFYLRMEMSPVSKTFLIKICQWSMSKRLIIAFDNGIQNMLKTVHHFSQCTSEPSYLKEMWIFVNPYMLIISI